MGVEFSADITKWEFNAWCKHDDNLERYLNLSIVIETPSLSKYITKLVLAQNIVMRGPSGNPFFWGKRPKSWSLVKPNKQEIQLKRNLHAIRILY
jgi:hypothetical protein